MTEPLVRTCRYGHGPLQKEGGVFGLVGLKYGQYTSPLAQALAKSDATPNGRVMTVLAHKCQTCGYVELEDA